MSAARTATPILRSSAFRSFRLGIPNTCGRLKISTQHFPKPMLNGVAAARTPSTKTESSDGVNNDSELIWGEVLDFAVNLRKSRPGDRIDIPYELTVSDSIQGFWHASFHAQDRISTSRPFARKIGLQDKVLPFSLVLFLASSMTHADAAKVQVGFGSAIYHWPAFTGDTFTKSFQVKSIRNTSDGNHSIFHISCELLNQRGRLCMNADKRMMFEFPVPDSNVTASGVTTAIHNSQQMFRDHVLSKASVLQNEVGSHSLSSLSPGQLILHTMNRSLTLAQSQQLASLARLTHARHFDVHRYDEKTGILIPGGLVLGLAMSASSRDLHELLHEELISCSYINNLHPGDVVGGITFVKSVDDTFPGDLESVVVRTIGVKNMDVVRDLDGVGLPLELFTGSAITTKDVELICKENCPKLSNKIIVQFDRRILRQSNKNEVFLL